MAELENPGRRNALEIIRTIGVVLTGVGIGTRKNGLRYFDILFEDYSVDVKEENTPKDYELTLNRPNPFNSNTTIDTK